MAFTNQTTHYGLPLPIGSDKSTWLDNNTAFAAIDAAIYQASTDAAAAAGDISTIQGDITSLQSGKQNVLTFDAAPTLGSTNPVTSGGVYDAVALKLDSSTYTTDMGNTSISGIGDGTVTGAIKALSYTRTSFTITKYGDLISPLLALAGDSNNLKDVTMIIDDGTTPQVAKLHWARGGVNPAFLAGSSAGVYTVSTGVIKGMSWGPNTETDITNIAVSATVTLIVEKF